MLRIELLESLSIFELWNPWTALILIGIAGVYLYLVRINRQAIQDSKPVTVKTMAYFITGLLIYYIAQGSPLSLLGHHWLFSAHMMQQSLALFVVPPLILLGIPEWLLRTLLPEVLRKKVLPLLLNPILAVFIFNGLLSFYHFPLIYDGIMSDHTGLLKNGSHLILFISAFQMWWVIIEPLPELARMSDLKRLGYVVLNGLLLYPACALIIFANDIIYKTYFNAPQVFTFLSPLGDQQLGGVIMKIMQEGVFIVALAYIFKHWYRRERTSGDEI